MFDTNNQSLNTSPEGSLTTEMTINYNKYLFIVFLTYNMRVKCSDIGGDCDTIFEDESDINTGIVNDKCPVCNSNINVPEELWILRCLTATCASNGNSLNSRPVSRTPILSVSKDFNRAVG